MRIRIYYEDTDAGGVVYNASYLRFFERARTEWLRDRGIDLKEWMDRDTLFVVSELGMKFLAPAVYGDLLEMTTEITELKKASLVFEHSARARGHEIVSGTTRLACIDRTGAIIRIPKEIRDVIGGKS